MLPFVLVLVAFILMVLAVFDVHPKLQVIAFCFALAAACLLLWPGVR